MFVSFKGDKITYKNIKCARISWIFSYVKMQVIAKKGVNLTFVLFDIFVHSVNVLDI